MTEALTQLAELAEARAEKGRLEVQLEAARAQQEEAEQRVAAARRELTEEQGDVDQLESMSMTRILAGLRGRRDMDLDRERAEAAAAHYAVAEAEARAAAATQQVAALRRAIEQHGDLDARHRELLALRQEEVHADPAGAAAAGELDRLAEREGAARAELTEVEEADAAGRQAHSALSAAAQHLGSARSWSTYDTFFGGGLVADMVKHDKLDRAAQLMRAADAALSLLATELADVGIQPVGDVGIPQLTRALDVWFDNIFSDWAVRDRISQAVQRVDALLATVAGIGRQLQDRRQQLTAELADLDRERERLLTA